MIINRNTFNEQNKKKYQLPYRIDTVFELKENPNTIAKIIQYRIDNNGIIYVGLSETKDTYHILYYEIPLAELKEKWQNHFPITLEKEFILREPTAKYSHIIPPESRELVRKRIKIAEEANRIKYPNRYIAR